jgi:hypothetical protein
MKRGKVLFTLQAILAITLILSGCSIYSTPQQSITSSVPNQETTPLPSPVSPPSAAQIKGDNTFVFTMEAPVNSLPLYLNKDQILELQWRLVGDDCDEIWYPWYSDPQGQIIWKYVAKQSGRSTYYSAGEGAPSISGNRDGIRQMIANVAGLYTFYFAASDMNGNIRRFSLYVHYESKSVADPNLLNPPKPPGEFRNFTVN